ncbi:hypothetical protein AXG93_1535s1000 [Marchantia polymorpha subsp. ruderalis]|uniref:Uncharacterized protein n=1 Tax=Marchantia polymorpha subsp. ruderalis TaxID=1480154 RepID=A0A176VTF6_MARPO|nr:hypothetical protein AXG93_1535s1000 [Marchantia polymorpha subsp. ruderalis]
MVPPGAMVRFVTPLGKDDVQVNKVKLSLRSKEEDNSWPDKETLVGRVETRSATWRKETSPERGSREKRGTSVKEAIPKGSPSKKEELRSKVSGSSA